MASSRNWPGQVFAGRYTVKEFLGHGTGGAVYKAIDEKDNYPVSLMILDDAVAESDSRFRLFNEGARSASGLTHTHTAKLLNFGRTAEGHLFTVTELLEGLSLAQILRLEQTIEPSRAATMIGQASLALGEAHSAGIVHGDINTHNIFVCRRQSDEIAIKILDFATARMKPPTPAVFLAYLAPEQVHARPVSPATDIYSLGIVYFEMLTGRPPFTGDSPKALAMQHIHDAPPSPEAVRPGLGLLPAIDGLVKQMLEKSPERRPVLAIEIAEIVLGSSSQTIPMPPPQDDDDDIGKTVVMGVGGQAAFDEGIEFSSGRRVTTTASLTAVASPLTTQQVPLTIQQVPIATVDVGGGDKVAIPPATPTTLQETPNAKKGNALPWTLVVIFGLISTVTLTGQFIGWFDESNPAILPPHPQVSAVAPTTMQPSPTVQPLAQGAPVAVPVEPASPTPVQVQPAALPEIPAPAPVPTAIATPSTAESPAPAPAPTVQAATAVVPAPAPVRSLGITLTTNPAGASVELNSKAVGVTPVLVDFKESDPPATLVFKAPGHESLTVVLVAKEMIQDGRTAYQWNLMPLEVKKPPSAKKAAVKTNAAPVEKAVKASSKTEPKVTEGDNKQRSFNWDSPEANEQPAPEAKPAKQKKAAPKDGKKATDAQKPSSTPSLNWNE